MYAIEILVRTTIILLTIFIVVYKSLYDLRDKRYKSYWKGLKKDGYILIILSIILAFINIYLLTDNIDTNRELKKLSKQEIDSGVIDKQNLNSTRPNIVFQKKESRWKKGIGACDSIRFCFYNTGCRSPKYTDFRIRYVETNNTYQPISKGQVKSAFDNWGEVMNREITFEQFCSRIPVYNDYKKEFYQDSLILILQLELDYLDKISNIEYTTSQNYYFSGSALNFSFGLPKDLKNKYNIDDEKIDIRNIFD